jgi:hypothetical protein
MKFYELAIGARFVFRGQWFVKIAMSMAEDERHWGNIFQGGTEVESEGPMLPADVAARWKPPDGHWTDGMILAPGQG